MTSSELLSELCPHPCRVPFAASPTFEPKGLSSTLLDLLTRFLLVLLRNCLLLSGEVLGICRDALICVPGPVATAAAA